jgi:predicted Zn-dependent protease
MDEDEGESHESDVSQMTYEKMAYIIGSKTLACAVLEYVDRLPDAEGEEPKIDAPFREAVTRCVADWTKDG